jgi:hypothetical protein
MTRGLGRARAFTVATGLAVAISLSGMGPQAGATAPVGVVHRDQAPSLRAPAAGTLRVSDRSIFPGDKVTFIGQLGSRVTEQRVNLQMYRNGKWRNIEGRYSGKAGKFRLREPLDYPVGTYRFRVMGVPGYLTAGAPRTVTPTVKVNIVAKPGSLDAPWRPGQLITGGGWRLTLGTTDTDSWPELYATWNESKPPPPGYSYISVPIAFTRTGPGSSHAGYANSLKFVGSDKAVYGQGTDVNGAEYYCSLSNDWEDAPELYTGGSGSGSECLLVPTAAIAGGLWRLEDNDYNYHYITIS